IRKLPHHLVEAFQATLEEVIQADVLMHVVDVSHPRVDEQIEAVERVLAELGIHDKPVIHVLNKIDQPATAAQVTRLTARLPRVAAVSALTGAGLEELLHLAADCLLRERRVLKLCIPLREAALLAALRHHGQVLSERYDESLAHLEVSVPLAWVDRCAEFVLGKNKD
ncbi:MAG: GTPase HflX, partial [Kiritimatiellaeota bacterium]|nr:GTPase HflX [Kiritimatiellota bacterium]